MTRIEMPIIEMTREEVIKTLKEHKIMFEHDFGWDRHTIKALEMAISALSENKGDLISRQAVFNTLSNMDKALDEERTVENYKELMIECIKMLPSVQPIRPKKITLIEVTEYCRDNNFTLVSNELFDEMVNINIIEDIKADIQRTITASWYNGENYKKNYRDGLDNALKIIDKHLADTRGE